MKSYARLPLPALPPPPPGFGSPHHGDATGLLRSSGSGEFTSQRRSPPAYHQFGTQDRFNINSQLEHLQSKYIGTGHADLTRFEWAVNIHRDSYASYVGHHPMLAYFAIAENEAVGRVRYNFLQVCYSCVPVEYPLFARHVVAT